MIGEHGLEFDTPAWCDLRNRKLAEWVPDAHARNFFIAFGDICELFDDVIDRDKPIEDEHAIRVLFTVLVDLPLNPFFNAHKQHLIPLMITGINAWLDANKIEKGGTREQKVFSFVLRDWCMELLSFIIYLQRGRDYMRSVSMEIRHFFTHHETLEEYLEKIE